MSNSWSAEQIPDQSGRTAVVTGANSGIGLVTARELARHGATVVVACRDVSEGRAGGRSRCGPTSVLRGDAAAFHVTKLDLADLDSVRGFASETIAAFPDGIDLLINNAGVMAPPRKQTADGFELQFGTNHLGHYALTGLLFDELKKKPGSRIVTVSSNAHKLGKLNFEDLQSENSYMRWNAYAQSKLANLVFALDLQRRIDEAGLDMKSMAAHPGLTATNLYSATAGTGEGLINLLTIPVRAVSNTLFAQDAEARRAADPVRGRFARPRRGATSAPRRHRRAPRVADHRLPAQGRQRPRGGRTALGRVGEADRHRLRLQQPRRGLNQQALAA